MGFTSTLEYGDQYNPFKKKVFNNFTFCKLLLYLHHDIKVHLIKEKTIRNYIVNYAGSKVAFEEWLSKIKLADWNMEALKYKIITSDKQYDKYCKTLEELVFSSPKTKANKDEIALLTLLIEKYDAEHNSFHDLNPVELLKALMKEHQMKAVDLARLLQVSEGLVSDMLKYKKGFSKETIRVLAETFKVSQEAFNRPYQLQMAVAVKNH